MHHFSFALVCLFAADAMAQCEPAWGSASPQPQLTGIVSCSTLWDPDGAGPLPQRIVIGGSNLTGGAIPSNAHVGTWDGTAWGSLGNGPWTSGLVRALTTWNGLLVAGGDFIGGGVDYVSLWDGSAWQPIGTGLTTPITALAVWNGQLIAAGTSTSSAAVIRAWNGAIWSSIPAPPTLRNVAALVVFQGQLCVGGWRSFPNPAAGVLERWNGTSWAPSILALGGLGITPLISCFAVRPSLAVGGSDTLYAGGNFTSIGGTSAVAVAATSGTGFAWSSVGGNPRTLARISWRATAASASA